MNAPHVLSGSAYVQYQYGYPHKTAYRALPRPMRLDEVWANENQEALSLYVHVPFCEMRCGFCNLFTVAGPREEPMARFVATLDREAMALRRAMPRARFSRVTVGGGTPTLLPPPLLARVLRTITETMGARTQDVPFGVEVSPETTTPERVKLLDDAGLERVSIGVQSFIDAETRALARPQERRQVERALDLLRNSGARTLNIDLIYGIEGQTRASFIESLEAALRWRPEEVYLYPLYVRPRTFLGKSSRAWDDFRLELYRAGREWLLERGYRQLSMRCFRASHAPGASGPAYRCQDDGMVGLGVGARSYTKTLHYSSEWAVTPKAVRGIIDGWCDRDDASFDFAHHGVQLNGAEQRRRHLILSLLADGLDAREYTTKFGADAGDDFPELRALVELGLAIEGVNGWRLTDRGVERSDALGPWLQSPDVSALMAAYEVT